MRGRKPDGGQDRNGAAGSNGAADGGVGGNDFRGPAAVQQGTANDQQFGDRYYTSYHLYPAPADPPAPAPAPPAADPWVSLVADSAAWRYVEPGADHEPLRRQAMAAALALARARDEACGTLRRDAWYEPRFAERVAYRVDWLFDNLWSGQDTRPLLSPAEAALLSLLPVLHHTRPLLRAARHLAVRPESLVPVSPADGPPDGARVAYERFLRTYGRLVRRANQRVPDPTEGDGDGDGGGHRHIAWWLYHRWLAADPELARDDWPVTLLAAAGVPGTDLADVLDARTLRRLLSAPYVSPHELCGIDGRPFLPAERWTPIGQASKEQRVRERFVGVVLAVAHGLAIRATELPPVIVRHLGTPGEVRLDELHRTLADARWEQRANGKERQLHARCAHNAVATALREHARTLDGLLRAVHRGGEHGSWPAELHALPVFVGDGGVVEVDAEGNELPPRAAVAFRFDEAAVQELLVGERLYRNPALAIRELYQNALDACRYRRARERAHAQRLGRRADSAGYEGEIAFMHGTTPDGRPYLRCRDNGVGMGEEELTGVFSEAGARFVESAAYLAEQAEWAELPEPVSVQPNSRFGIGVLSYFMLADEIEVSTRRLHRDGAPGRRLTVRITGPGQFFQVVEEPEDGPRTTEHTGPGTTVTLYLREDATDQSATDTLQSLLGYAEFRTTATRADGTGEVWEPGVMTPRVDPSWGERGIDAHGEVAHWQGRIEHEGRSLTGQVMWCQYGGGLLVDGLHALPGEKHRGTLMANSLWLRGALVNLDGGWGVALSVDRTEILQDVGPAVVKLLEAATEPLVRPGSELLTFRWLCAVAYSTPPLGDLVTAAADAARLPLSLEREETTGRNAHEGCYPVDPQLAGRQVEIAFHNADDAHTLRRPHRYTLDHILLWRVLARRWTADLDRLAALVPELDAGEEVLVARPTDALILQGPDAYEADGAGDWPRLPGALVREAREAGMTPRRFAARAAELGVDIPVDHFPDVFPPDPLDLALLSSGLDGSSPWLDTTRPVPVAHLLEARSQRGIGLADARRRLAAYGFSVPETDHLPARLDRSDAVLLSTELSGTGPWLAETPVRPGHVAAAAVALRTTPAEVRARLESFGLTTHPWRTERAVRAADLEMLRSDSGERHRWLDAAEPVPPGRILEVAVENGREPTELAALLGDLGFTLPPVIPLLSPERRERDLLLLSRDGDGVGPWLTTRQPLSALHLQMLARATGVPVSETVEHLTGAGFTLAGGVTPGSGDPQLLTLLRQAGFRLESTDWAKPVPLLLLLNAARQTGRGIAEIADRLREWGLCVRDPAEQVREALARVPRRRPS
ncbi:hypothetical protein [Streptomyces sp. Z26]|uniref:wHTH domain-containing protein n=1 Tax=Streptomyces sp. Z26 TaxID=2500177 RepID=UPI000EF146A7|nr:hypothetical protein [Streptomyces sp. Z26]RLL65756.1 hypothetical protein D7M15_01300 [Streptomyces sp. Z26]